MQGPKWPLFYSHIDPVWSLLIIGTGCTLSRAPRTKETLLDFREWCRVTRHPRVFRGLTGCQRTPRFWGVTKITWVLECIFSDSDASRDIKLTGDSRCILSDIDSIYC